jgi:hypothetical protein
MTTSLRTIAVAVTLAGLLGTVASCGDDETISARFESMSTPPKPEQFHESGGSEAFFAAQEDPWEQVIDVLVDDFGLTGVSTKTDRQRRVQPVDQDRGSGHEPEIACGSVYLGGRSGRCVSSSSHDRRC